MQNQIVSPGPGSYVLPSEFGSYSSKKEQLIEPMKRVNKNMITNQNSESSKKYLRLKKTPSEIPKKQLKQMFEYSPENNNKYTINMKQQL